jgi:hypothetical protein
MSGITVHRHLKEADRAAGFGASDYAMLMAAVRQVAVDDAAAAGQVPVDDAAAAGQVHVDDAAAAEHDPVDVEDPIFGAMTEEQWAQQDEWNAVFGAENEEFARLAEGLSTWTCPYSGICYAIPLGFKSVLRRNTQVIQQSKVH